MVPAPHPLSLICRGCTILCNAFVARLERLERLAGIRENHRSILIPQYDPRQRLDADMTALTSRLKAKMQSAESRSFGGPVIDAGTVHSTSFEQTDRGDVFL